MDTSVVNYKTVKKVHHALTKMGVKVTTEQVLAALRYAYDDEPLAYDAVSAALKKAGKEDLANRVLAVLKR